MNTNTEQAEQEFEILGHKVNFRPDDDENFDPQEIVEEVISEVDQIKRKNPGLGDKQTLILLALQLVSKRYKQENIFKSNIKDMQLKASDALHLIEEATPPTLS